MYRVAPIQPEDLDMVFELYAAAAQFQREKKEVVVWPEFDRAMVQTEIEQGRQYKLLIDDAVACIWAIAFNDAQIWEHRENNSSVYIHRIATAPPFRGQSMVKKIVAWGQHYALENNKTHLRLDTLGNNTKLIDHYQAAGFTFLGMFPLQNPADLPLHYQTAPACLFEIDLTTTTHHNE